MARLRSTTRPASRSYSCGTNSALVTRQRFARPGGRGEGEAAEGGLVAARVLGAFAVVHLAGDLVPHPVDHPSAVDLLVGLRDVGVRAEDQVDVRVAVGGRGGEPPGEVELQPVGLVLPFGAPVHGEHDDVGASLPGGAGVGDHAVGVHQVDRPGLAGRQRVAVGAEGVRQVGDLGRARPEDRDRAGLGLAAGGPGVPEAGPVHGVEGAPDAVGAVVQGVVGGGGAAVVAGGGEGVGDLRRRLEVGVAGVVAVGAVDGLHVTQRQVGAGRRRFDAGQHGAEVVAAAAGVEGGPFDDGGVGQDVPGGDEGEAAGRGGRRAALRAGLPVLVLAGRPGREDGGQGQGHLLSASDHQLTPGLSYIQTKP